MIVRSVGSPYSTGVTWCRSSMTVAFCQTASSMRPSMTGATSVCCAVDDFGSCAAAPVPSAKLATIVR